MLARASAFGLTLSITVSGASCGGQNEAHPTTGGSSSVRACAGEDFHIVFCPED